NPFGGFMGLLLPLSIMASYSYLVRLWQHWRREKQIIITISVNFLYYVLATGLMLGGLLTSWSRGAWLGFVVALAVMAFCLPRKLWQSLALVTASIALVAGLWFTGLLPASIQTRILSSTEELFAFNDVRGVD